MEISNPFTVPSELPGRLSGIFAYWQKLRRGANEMPFADDLQFAAVLELSRAIVVLDVFADPERFRFNLIGDGLLVNQEASAHKFLDEVQFTGQLAYLRSQASATVEAAQPTYMLFKNKTNQPAFKRLLLPMWGRGQIGTILGVAETG
jgi:hypothetical protein